MVKYFWLLPALAGIFFWGACFGQDDERVYPPLNENLTYCLEFTWFGPEYDNNSQFNMTCDEYKDEYRAGDNIPCAAPVVISTDGSIPDVDWLWENHQNSVACRKAENQECVTYTFWENNLITNQTHMCARVRSGSSSTPYGCYKQEDNGNDVELCICQGQPGLHRPCNSGAVTLSVSFATIVLSLVISYVKAI